MSDIPQLIIAYESSTTDPNGECDTNVRVAADLGDALDDENALAFILKIVSDGDEHDLARIEALKCLQRHSATDATIHQAIGGVIARVIVDDNDLLVRQHAAQSAFPYMDVSSTFSAVTDALLDPETQIDIRYNCLHAFKHCTRNENVPGVMTQLSTDPVLGKSAKRVLKSYGVDIT